MTAPRILPDDAHNETLVAHVHPSDWTNPTPQGRYNLVVIGAGSAGLVTAAGAAGLGARVALIERHLMGGDCLNVGCVPSKALIRSAHAAAHARPDPAFGVRVDGDVVVDFPAVMARMRRLRARIAPHDSAARFRDLGVDVYLGEARFVAEDTVEVGGQRLTFRRAVIATGRRPAAPPIPGLDDAGYLTNETVFELTELPARLAVIGGGPIGLELAQSFARFGSRVTVLERESRLLPRDEADAAAIIERALRADGVAIDCGAEITRVAGRAPATVTWRTADGAEREAAFDAILVAAGRKPNLESLALESAGIERDEHGELVVDDRLRTTNKRVFTAGDVGFRYQFTHAADATARLVIANALFYGRGKASRLTIPWATYTDPEVAHIGLDPDEARRRGVEIDTWEQPLSGLDRAILDGDDEGFVRVYTRKGKDEIVGATIVARHAGDLVSHLSMAMKAGVGLGTIASTVFPYPTQAEAIKRTADAWNRTRLKPWVARLFQRWFAWTR